MSHNNISMTKSINDKFYTYKKNRKKINFIYVDECPAKSNKCKIALVVPYRNREAHLEQFLKFFNGKFDIYVVEQNNNVRFNHGILRNIGFIIAEKFNYDTYIFNDVDAIPDDTILSFYNCCCNFDILNFYVPERNAKYSTMHDLLGNAYSIVPSIFKKINGFPINFYGWGGEDDALYNRIAHYDIPIYRPARGSFNLLDHPASSETQINQHKKENVLNDLDNFQSSGLNQTIFHIDSEFHQGTYHHYKVSFDVPDEESKSNSGLIFHPTLPQYRSYIQPLVEWSEIQTHIIDTYTDPVRFDNPDTNNIKSLVSSYFSRYSHLTKSDLVNTLEHLFMKKRDLLFYRIRNNKLVCAYHLYNSRYKNDGWTKNIKFKYNLDVDRFRKLHAEKTGTRENNQSPLPPDEYTSNNCIVSFQDYKEYGNPTTYVANITELITSVIESYQSVPDCDLIVNRKDFPFFRKDCYDGYDNIYKRDKCIDLKGNKWVICSQSTTPDHIDVPIPTSDEWESFKHDEKINQDWTMKKNIAVFRGSPTGCGANTNNNPRLRLAYIARSDPKLKSLLNVGLHQPVNRVKVYNYTYDFIDKHLFYKLFKKPLTYYEQSLYKYIFYIEGNSAAYRYATLFKFKSVVIAVESKYKLWFEPLLDGSQTITVNRNYDNLYKQLNYLIDNDDLAKSIAENGFKFYTTYINKKTIMQYMFYVMVHTNNLLF